MNWTKVVLQKGDVPVKVYVNREDTRCFVFPLFGKYYGVHSDKSAIDLCIQIMFHIATEYPNPGGIRTLDQYISSQEDTAITYQEAA